MKIEQGIWFEGDWFSRQLMLEHARRYIYDRTADFHPVKLAYSYCVLDALAKYANKMLEDDLEALWIYRQCYRLRNIDAKKREQAEEEETLNRIREHWRNFKGMAY